MYLLSCAPWTQRSAARRCHVVVVFSGQRRSFQLLSLFTDAVGSFSGGGIALITLSGIQPRFKSLQKLPDNRSCRRVRSFFFFSFLNLSPSLSCHNLLRGATACSVVCFYFFPFMLTHGSLAPLSGCLSFLGVPKMELKWVYLVVLKSNTRSWFRFGTCSKRWVLFGKLTSELTS